MFSILVVEDDKTLNQLMTDRLRMESYQVYQAFHGQEALDFLDVEHIDLIISDIMMPYMNGLELTKLLRETKYMVPILMITAMDRLEDMEKGFDAGTDDYMIKPIYLKEMVLRVKALLKRAQIASEHRMLVGNTQLDYDTLTVCWNGKEELLPKKEFYLLFLLLSYPNKIFTRQQLMDEIWGMEAEFDDRTVDSHIKKLRRRFEENKDFEIITVRGLGYKARKETNREKTL